MLIRIGLLLVVVPLVELALLLTLADVTGFTATLAMVVATGLFGAWLLRRQGLKTLQGIGTELRSGRIPSNEILDGVLVLMAGLLMITPGVLTDLVGIALLIPGTRAVFRRWLLEYCKSRIQLVRFPNSTDSTNRRVEVIDSYVVGSSEDRKT